MSKRKVEDPNVMTLEKLVAEVEVLADLTPEQAKKVVWTIFWTMEQALNKRESVCIKTFGTFSVRMRPRTRIGDVHYGGIKELPAKWIAQFKPHKMVKYLLNPHEFTETG